MADFKCDSCGGQLIPENGTPLAKCRECGYVQPLPAPTMVLQKKKKRLILILIAATLVIVTVAAIIIYNQLPSTRYDRAVALMEEGRYTAALEILEELGSYKDSGYLSCICMYGKGIELYKQGEYEEAHDLWNRLNQGGATISYDNIKQELEPYCKDQAYKSLNQGDYVEAVEWANRGYLSADYKEDIYAQAYDRAVYLSTQVQTGQAKAIFAALGDYRDSQERLAALQ